MLASAPVRVALAVGALAVGALGFTGFTYLRTPPPPPEIGGYVLAAPRALPAVALVAEDDAPFPVAAFAGHWSFLYFGYTYCPDACPLALLELAALKKALAAPTSAGAQFYLVSVDPQRDTPERLREYVRYFDPTFRGLTGPLDAVTALATATDTVFFVPEGQSPEGYLVNHSNNIVLLNPAGALHAVFTSPHNPAQLAADFAKILGHYAANR